MYVLWFKKVNILSVCAAFFNKLHGSFVSELKNSIFFRKSKDEKSDILIIGQYMCTLTAFYSHGPTWSMDQLIL